MARSASTGILFIVAGLWTLFALLVICASLASVFTGYDDSGVTDGTWAICSTVSIVVMVVLWAVWFMKKNREDLLDDVASFLRISRRTHIRKVAEHFRIETQEAEKLLLACISKGHIKGYLDRKTGEFMMEESISQMQAGAKCPNCGGYTNDVTLPGEVLNCQYCAAVIPKNIPPPPAPPAPPKDPALVPPARGGKIMLCSNCRREIPLDSNLCPYCGSKF